MTDNETKLKITSPLQAINLLKQAHLNPISGEKYRDSALDYLDTYFGQDRLQVTEPDKRKIAKYLLSLSRHKEIA